MEYNQEAHNLDGERVAAIIRALLAICGRNRKQIVSLYDDVAFPLYGALPAFHAMQAIAYDPARAKPPGEIRGPDDWGIDWWMLAEWLGARVGATLTTENGSIVTLCVSRKVTKKNHLLVEWYVTVEKDGKIYGVQPWWKDPKGFDNWPIDI